jgi:hypothetical protein
MTKLCLIDSRINDYNIFIDSVKSGVFYILIDYLESTKPTFFKVTFKKLNCNKYDNKIYKNILYDLVSSRL